MRVLIVGGGVGGLSLARCLRLQGVDCRILEARRDIVPAIDRGLGLWDQSQLCLGLMGLGSFLDSSARRIRPAAYRSMSGHWLSRSSPTPENSRRVACVSQNQLMDAILKGVDIELSLGKKVVEIQQHQDRAVVHLADGEVAEGSVVVCADGAHSSIRKSLFPEAELCDIRHECLSGIVDKGFPDEAFETLGCTSGTNGSNQKGFLRVAVIPLTQDRTFWFATRRSFSRVGPELSLSEVSSATADWHHPVPDIVEAAHKHEAEGGGKSRLLREQIVSLRRPLKRWWKERVVLMGDACHTIPPNLAQGAAVAIEDAIALSRALAQSGGTHQHAFAEFQKTRQRRVSLCRNVTGFTQLLSDNPTAASLMRFVPNAINSAVFDAFCEFV